MTATQRSVRPPDESPVSVTVGGGGPTVSVSVGVVSVVSVVSVSVVSGVVGTTTGRATLMTVELSSLSSCTMSAGSSVTVTRSVSPLASSGTCAATRTVTWSSGSSAGSGALADPSLSPVAVTSVSVEAAMPVFATGTENVIVSPSTV